MIKPRTIAAASPVVRNGSLPFRHAFSGRGEGNREQTMEQYKFKAGQSVELRGRAGAWLPSGLFNVVRTLPSDGRQNQYRLKSVKDGHERVATEGEIVLAAR